MSHGVATLDPAGTGAVVRHRPRGSARARRGPPGIRALAASFALVFGAITMTVVGTLAWTATAQRASTEELARESAHAERAARLYRALLAYRRVADREDWAGIRPPGDARARAVREVRELLAERAPPAAGRADEETLLAAAAEDVDVYVRAREAGGAAAAPHTETGAQLSALLDRALANLAALDALAEEALERSRVRAAWISRRAEAVSLAAAMLLTLAVFSLGFALQRLVGRPLVALSATIRRFHEGSIATRAPRTGVREIAETADSFNRMAAALSRQREAQLVFLAGVVHDLRNPLGALKLGIHSLRAPQSAARSARTFDLVDRQLDRLSRLVDDVMDATQIEAGRLELRRERYDVRRSMAEVLDLYRPMASSHELVAEVAGEPLVVDADPVRIEQVVGNLLSNAIKYSPGGRTIELRAARDRDRVILEVRDHGIGIRHDDLADVFAPFRRRAPEVAGGAGLGLSVARHIVEAHRGTIEVESELGVGSVFRVCLPLAAPAELSPAREDA